MVSLLHPLWLLGLGLVPLVWWLHRQGGRTTVTVAAAFLFEATRGSNAPASHQRADPVWLLRALVISIIFVALASPHVDLARPPSLTVWLDTSISMRTVENGQTRQETASQRIVEALRDGTYGEVTLRSLTDRRSPLSLETWTDADSIADWALRTRYGPSRFPVALAQDETHWIVTDGADASLNGFLKGQPNDRLFLIGTERNNVSIARLSARRSLSTGSEDSVEGLVRIYNAGEAAAVRRLRVFADSNEIADLNVALAPGSTATESFSAPHQTMQFSAELDPDALAEDDTLRLDLTELKPIAVHLDPLCPAPLKGALVANPGIRIDSSLRDAELNIECSDRKYNTEIPVVDIASQPDSVELTGPLYWPAASFRPIQMDARTLNRRGPTVPLTDNTVLAIDNESLIDVSAGVVHVYIDMAHQGLAKTRQYPVLVDRILELATARPISDPIVSVEIPESESIIAPGPSVEGATEIRPRAASAAEEVASIVILIAAILLALDIWFSVARPKVRWLEATP